MSAGSFTSDQSDALDAARHLIAHGVPVFAAEPALDAAGNWKPDGGHQGTGYWFPKEWEQTPADPRTLNRWKPGWALGAVMGHTVDGLDIDPRHKGDETAIGWQAAGLYPTSYGRQQTPSGGWHDIVAPLGVESLDGVAPGVDLKAGQGDQGHGFLFIAPTLKRSKATGEIGAYTWQIPPHLDDLDPSDDSGAFLADQVKAKRSAKSWLHGAREATPADRVVFDALPPAEQARIRAYLAGAVGHIGAELDAAKSWPDGYRDARTDKDGNPLAGRGWQKLTADAAYRLGALARAPWSPWSVDDGRDAFLAIVPPAIDTAVGAEDTWDAQHKRSPLPPFPVDPRAEWLADLNAANAALTGPQEGPTDGPDGETPADGPESPPDAPQGSPRGWGRVDLRETVQGLISGTLRRAAPTVGTIDGGSALFYRGKVNGLAGESGGGKTWTALHVAQQALDGGVPVVYVDHEDDAAGIVGRLLDLGTDPDAVVDLFAYLNPTEKPTLLDLQALAELVAELKPDLVVVDSTGEGLALEGANPNADEEVAAWFLRVPRRLAMVDYGGQPGPAVVVLDHVIKSDDGGLWPIGSQRKRAAITGAQYMQRTVKPFSKDEAGRAVLICAKDRHGCYRAGQRVAELHVTPTPEGPAIALEAVEPLRAGEPFRPTVLMDRVSRALEDADEPLSCRAIQDRVKGKKDAVAKAVEVLTAEGYVATTPGSRNAILHHIVKPFRGEQSNEGSQTADRPRGTVAPVSDPKSSVDRPPSLGKGTGGQSPTVPGGRSGDGGGRSSGEGNIGASPGAVLSPWSAA